MIFEYCLFVPRTWYSGKSRKIKNMKNCGSYSLDINKIGSWHLFNLGRNSK